MSELCIFLFGKFQMQYDQVNLSSFNACKAQELFCYLLLNYGQPHRREKLAGLLWEDASTEQAKGYLRKALWQLQTALETTPSAYTSLLTVEPDCVQLNPDDSVWLDAAVFEKTFRLVESMPGWQLDGSHYQSLVTAVKLYRGELMEDWYEGWCLYERERFQLMYLIISDKLLDYCEAHGKYETGLLYGTTVLYHDQARERTHRCLMRLHYLAGNRTEALRQYERCAHVLAKELGVKPAKRTQALYEKIKNDQPLLPFPVVSGQDHREETAVALPQILVHFNQLQDTLSDIQDLLQQGIDTVEATYKSHHTTTN